MGRTKLLLREIKYTKGVQLTLRAEDDAWWARWEVPSLNVSDTRLQMVSDTRLQMVGEWIGPYELPEQALEMADQDFAGSAAEPQNTEYLNDR